MQYILFSLVPFTMTHYGLFSSHLEYKGGDEEVASDELLRVR